jgi:hypothetical protein
MPPEPAAIDDSETPFLTPVERRREPRFQVPPCGDLWLRQHARRHPHAVLYLYPLSLLL